MHDENLSEAWCMVHGAWKEINVIAREGAGIAGNSAQTISGYVETTRGYVLSNSLR